MATKANRKSTNVVSVLLCTHNSRRFLPMVLDCYRAQDYEDRELVIIDDGDDLIADLIEDMSGVTYIHHPARNLAAKRNVGLRFARGEYVAHFDSDDWSGPGRISHQLGMIHLFALKVVGYSQAFWYDTRQQLATFAQCGLWGATLCYERAWGLAHPWDEMRDTCEDAWFLDPAMKDLGALGEMSGDGHFVALAHERNAPRPFGEPGWDMIPCKALPAGFRVAMGIPEKENVNGAV